MSFFTTPEFYVILVVVSTAIVALAARPTDRGPAQEHLLAGVLVQGDPSDPQVHIACLDDGNIALSRRGLADITTADAVSLVVKVIGTDVNIEERLDLARTKASARQSALSAEPVSEALFNIDFLPPGRYHIRYNSEKTGLFAAFPLHVRPDLTTTHALTR